MERTQKQEEKNMKNRNYLLAVTALSLTVFLTGCGGEKKDNSQNAGQTQDAVQESEEENSEEDSSTADEQDEESSPADQTEANSHEKALEFEVGDYVKLGEYKGIEVSYPAIAAVTDEDVQTSIDEQLTESSELKETEADYAAKDGDTVNIDYTGTVDGEEYEGGSDTGVDLELGAEEFLPEFEENLDGKKAGETVVFTLKFPEDYDEELGGKEAEFTVKVNSVSQLIMPEYNEDFVKEVSDCKTIEEFEASVRKDLEESAKEDSKMEAEENGLRLAIENAEINGYPQELYDFFYDDTVSGYQSYAEMMGMEYEEFMESFMGEDEVEEIIMEQVTEYLVCRAILEQEGIEVTDKEYSTEAEKMAKENEYETLEEYESDYGKIYIMTQIVREKAIDIVHDSAKLKEVSQEEYYEDDELEVEEEE